MIPQYRIEQYLGAINAAYLGESPLPEYPSEPVWRIEVFLAAILSAVKGDSPVMACPDPVWHIEEFARAIYDALVGASPAWPCPTATNNIEAILHAIYKVVADGTETDGIATSWDIERWLLDSYDAAKEGGGGTETTVTGNLPLTLANAISHAIVSLTRYGLCTQASTPTPSAPVDIMCNNGALRMVDDELPAGYKRLIGITFDGNIRYETGEYLTGDDDVTMTLNNISSSGKNLFGSYNGANDKNFSMYIYGSSTSGSYFRYGDQLKRPKYGGTGKRTITFGKSGTSGFADDSDVTPDEFTTPANTYIGMLPNSSSAAFTGDIIGSITVSNRLEWIPCERESDGVIGYYEKYNGNFIAPTGSGTPVSLGYDTSHMTVLSIVGDAEVLTVSASGAADQTATVESLLAVGSVADEQNLINGVVIRRCAVCCYDGTQTIGDVYMSTTGGKDLGAIIVYPLATPTTEQITGQNLVTNEGTNIVDSVANVSPLEAEVKYMAQDVLPKKTVSGAMVHITNALAKAALSVLASIEPIQDLHGYASPWPAGGGKNKFDASAATFKKWQLVSNAFEPKTDDYEYVSFSVSGENITLTTQRTYMGICFAVDAVDYDRTASLHGTISGGKAIALYNGYTSGATRISNGKTSCLIPANTSGYVAIRLDSAQTCIINCQIEQGSTASSWTPFSNICPISGIDNLSVYVSPTTQQAQATTYNVSFGAAGTVYGGTLDVVTGVLTVDRASISSYAGETLPGAWISDRDVYAPGTSPTTGAQVVYELATPLTYQLTAQEVQMLLGENYVWSSSGDTVSVTYYAEGNANPLQSLNILLGGNYSNPKTADDVSDKEALEIILGGNK